MPFLGYFLRVNFWVIFWKLVFRGIFEKNVEKPRSNVKNEGYFLKVIIWGYLKENIFINVWKTFYKYIFLMLLWELKRIEKIKAVIKKVVNSQKEKLFAWKPYESNDMVECLLVCRVVLWFAAYGYGYGTLEKYCCYFFMSLNYLKIYLYYIL